MGLSISNLDYNDYVLKVKPNVVNTEKKDDEKKENKTDEKNEKQIGGPESGKRTLPGDKKTFVTENKPIGGLFQRNDEESQLDMISFSKNRAQSKDVKNSDLFNKEESPKMPSNTIEEEQKDNIIPQELAQNNFNIFDNAEDNELFQNILNMYNINEEKGLKTADAEVFQNNFLSMTSKAQDKVINNMPELQTKYDKNAELKTEAKTNVDKAVFSDKENQNQENKTDGTKDTTKPDSGVIGAIAQSKSETITKSNTGVAGTIASNHKETITKPNTGVAGAIAFNHKETITKPNTGVAGAIAFNHKETITKPNTGVAGAIAFNHKETITKPNTGVAGAIAFNQSMDKNPVSINVNPFYQSNVPLNNNAYVAMAAVSNMGASIVNSVGSSGGFSNNSSNSGSGSGSGSGSNSSSGGSSGGGSSFA